MNVLFLNSLEKQTGENRVKTAQVQVLEDKGKWKVFWQETLDSGKTVANCWYDGAEWEEMRRAFRSGLREKTREGYSPLFRALREELPAVADRAVMMQMLLYYSQTHTDKELFQTLRKWRREQAIAEGKSPFIVATNTMLQLISTFVPHTAEELLQIPGFGKQRAASYGQALLSITSVIPRNHAFPLDWVRDEVDMEAFLDWLEEEARQKEQMQQFKEENKKRLLDEISGGCELGVLQRKLSLRRRELLQWVEELDREGYDVLSLIEAELKAVPQEEKELAWNAFLEEGDRYLKPIFNRIYGETGREPSDPNRTYEWLRLMRLKFRREKEAALAEAE
jgi:hypothetical protein